MFLRYNGVFYLAVLMVASGLARPSTNKDSEAGAIVKALAKEGNPSPNIPLKSINKAVGLTKDENNEATPASVRDIAKGVDPANSDVEHTSSREIFKSSITKLTDEQSISDGMRVSHEESSQGSLKISRDVSAQHELQNLENNQTLKDSAVADELSQFAYKYSNPVEAAIKLFSGDNSDANERAHAAWELARRSLEELHKIEDALSGSTAKATLEAEFSSNNHEKKHDDGTKSKESRTEEITVKFDTDPELKTQIKSNIMHITSAP